MIKQYMRLSSFVEIIYKKKMTT